MEYSPKKMQEKMNENNFGFKKKFGQNFIIDENIINGIVTKAEIDDETLVIEIGPGAGSLTNGIAKKAKNVLCYEIDTTLENMLKDNLKEYNNIEIIFGDFLNANVIEDIKKYSYKKLYVVANLPYYITTPIILKLIEDKIMPDKIVVMVQKEVGDRFKAKPGTKDYSSLSVYLNYYFSITKLMDISRNVFMPRPNVDSIVVEFKKINNNIELKDKDVFFKLVRDSFVQKRKTLRNNLKNYDLNKIEEVLKKHNFDLSVRAEQLSIEIFAEISNNL
ncbi:MAG: 16S rRNA (adenine(1518)-N(6)/adenine(1519)-N(6))-dimethyltransferase RsmA [Bacilli bacterium]|jgi:16S rRNA (adenine1518-N6/adenine1519-N6)-dimethyltransferase|nr:16S rRNA (adenine(1518)-N(6)/adenine(1519)-N(6))-dimethyltransferase RsmA [Bacilli bacterium]